MWKKKAAVGVDDWKGTTKESITKEFSTSIEKLYANEIVKIKNAHEITKSKKIIVGEDSSKQFKLYEDFKQALLDNKIKI